MNAVDNRVLIVDDDDFALDVLENTLSRLGFSCVSARDGNEAMEVLRRGDTHLVITDWDMPNLNGIDLCRAIRRDDLSGYVYIIMLTGREGAKQRLEGLCAGADDFINKPVDPEELLVCLKTAERILSLETRDLALFAMAKLAESRDSETGAHIERVQSYARLIARSLSAEVRAHYGIDEEYIRLLHQTSPLHDLGKVAIPDAILLKPGKLTAEEFTIMKTHTFVGAQTLDAALQRFPNARFLQMAREIAATHHEKFDGTGYPQGLVGTQIPLCGRLVAVADVYDALTTRRIYKDAMTHPQARAVIVQNRGRHFDPDVVDAFVAAEEQIIAVRERLSDEPKLTVEEIALPVLPVNLGKPKESNILVVEDDPLMLKKLTELLSATGVPVLSHNDGEPALKALAEHGARVVVSDWEMPGIDGVELCRRIRAGDTNHPVHFIMLTAHSDTNRLLDAYEAGINDFVSKPFNPEELLARVRAGLRAAKLHDELVRKAAGSQALNAQLTIVNSRLERLSITDELTGLFNRRHAMSRLEEQWSLGDRYNRPVSVAMIDIDHFKKVNDAHGHDAGDIVLRRVAGILRDQTRGTDAVCRVGGEEFLIIFPSQTTAEAMVCAERCRAAVAAAVIEAGGAAVRATVSIGLASRSREMSQFPDLLKAADQALYAAKSGGRNAVRVADRQEEPAAPASADRLTISTDRSASRPPVDYAVVLKRCGGDTAFMAAITDKFRENAVVEVEAISSALAAADANRARRAAHTLKSMTAYMSADSASELSRQIEDLAYRGNLAEAGPLAIHLRTEVERVILWIDTNKPTGLAS